MILMSIDSIFQKVDSSYNFLSDTLTFKRHVLESESNKLHDFKLSQSLSIVNVRRLGFWNVSKIEQAVNKKTVVTDFLDYEASKFVEVNFRDISSRVKIVIKSRHVKFIHHLLDTDRDDLGIGLIFLLQAITDDIITDIDYLKELLVNQVAPDIRVTLDAGNSLYAYPYYSSIRIGDVRNIQDRAYSTATNDHLKKHLSIENMNDLQMKAAAFLCQDDETLVFGSFLKNPTLSFDSNVDFFDAYLLKDMVFKYCVLVPLQSLESLTKKELVNFAKSFIGVCEQISWIYYYERDLKENYDDIRSKILETLFKSKGNKTMEVLRIFRGFPKHDEIDFGHALYANIVNYVCNIMHEHSINDADEFMSAYLNTTPENSHVFLDDNTLSRMMKYFEDEKTVSFEMWLYLNDFMIS